MDWLPDREQVVEAMVVLVHALSPVAGSMIMAPMQLLVEPMEILISMRYSPDLVGGAAGWPKVVPVVVPSKSPQGVPLPLGRIFLPMVVRAAVMLEALPMV